MSPPAEPLTQPTALCASARPGVPCRTATEIEHWLRDPRLEILGSAPTPGGTQDAQLMTLAIPSPLGRQVFRAKWRPHSSGSLLNEPRKELGAYAVQKLLLEPYEYVVPPTAGHCFDLGSYRRHVAAEAPPSFPNVTCVYGILSYWLEGAVEVEDAEDKDLLDSEEPYDPERFARNPSYRRSVADLNLITYLIHHGDAHGKQFLVTEQDGEPRVYTVDNSVAFESMKNPMMILRGADWSTIQVPSLPRAHVERLRALTRDEWARLAVIEQFRREQGRLVPIPTTGPAGPRDASMRWVGNELQVGLTDVEITGVIERARQLDQQLQQGKFSLF
jgi:hypothetical protein